MSMEIPKWLRYFKILQPSKKEENFTFILTNIDVLPIVIPLIKSQLLDIHFKLK